MEGVEDYRTEGAHEGREKRESAMRARTRVGVKKRKRKEIERKRETRQCLDHANCVVEVEAGAEIMVSIDPGGGGGLP